MNKQMRQCLTCAIATMLLFFAFLSPRPALALTGSLEVTPSSGPQGTSVTINGTGFTANYTYTLMLGASTAKTGITDAQGHFSTSFQIGSLPRGQYEITATTAAPDYSSTEYFTVTPEIKLSSASGRVGDQVTVSGTGFVANSSISLMLDNTSGGTVTTNSAGCFSNGILTVPASANGAHLITGRDSAGSSPGIEFKTSQTMSVTPVSGTVGDPISISGRGFGATGTVTLYLDGEVLNTVMAATDTNGSFTVASFAIPALPTGKHTFSAKDAAGNESACEMLVTYKMAISPATGTPGTTVRVTGDGFMAGKQIVVSYNDVPVVTKPESLVANARGSFRADFQVPGGLTGDYSIQASDGTNTAKATFRATLDSTISETTSAGTPGFVGMDLTISGVGFKPNTKININRDSSPAVLLATAVTDNVGAFSSTFVLPPTKSGAHIVTASDGTNTVKYNLFVESAPPPRPVLISPKADSKATRPVRFDWKDVADPSGVTYSLQVTSDDKFEKVVLEKEGLTLSEYAMTDDEKLESVTHNTPYYWRVRAIDNAGNVGDWSEEGTFHLGFVLTLPNGESALTLQAMAVYIGGLAALLLVGFAFWLGRRTTRRRIYLREIVASEELPPGEPPKLLK